MTTSAAQVSSGLPLVEMFDVTIASPEAPATAVLEGVNWCILPGEYWVVGALSSSGKSDLLMTAAGLLFPLRGVHRLFGRATKGLPDAELARARLRVGFVFADGGRLFRHLTVAANVLLPLSYHGDLPMQEAETQVRALLELMGLDPLANTPAARVSRNWRPRVALARALIMQPEVLFMDNPFAGLDMRQVAWWLDFLDQLSAGHPFLQGRPMALAATTDDFRPWVPHARQFALLKAKQWMALGGPAELAACQDPLAHELLATALVST
jgi:ABC-type transporter Mla maintaining outer membrane lipid asymmetry ATPase subunit MlaF